MPKDSLCLRDHIAFLAMIVGMFMALLDIQIVASSLTTIQSGLAASPDEISWVQTSYLIAEVVMIPASGFLSRLMSTRLLFAISSFGFTVASALCALSWDMTSMIVFRAIQGFVGGAMIPTVFAIAFSSFPPRQRNAVSVAVGLVATLAPTLGPSIGGWITEISSWHWLFLANLLPGVVVTFVAGSLIRFDKPDWSLAKDLDYCGLILMALFLGSLEYVVEEGPRHDWMGDQSIRLFTIVMGLAGCAFLIRVLRYRCPIVDVRTFANRDFLIGSTFSFIIGVGLFGSVYLLPLFLARIRGYTPLDIGVVMLVVGAFQLLSAAIAGKLASLLDLRFMLAVGLLLFGAGVYLQSLLTAEWGFWEFFLPLSLRGFAVMFLFIPVNAIALGRLPEEQLKNASALYNLMRNLGGAIGIAFFNTMLNDRLALHWLRLVEGLSSASPEVQSFLELQGEISAGLSGDGEPFGVKRLHDIVYREADVMTFADTQFVMAALFVASVLLVAFVRRPRLSAAESH